jgi:hypothetical protein
MLVLLGLNIPDRCACVFIYFATEKAHAEPKEEGQEEGKEAEGG